MLMDVLRNDTLRITQKSSINMLKMLQVKYGGTIDREYHYVISAKESIYDVLILWYDALIAKYSQVHLWMQFYSETLDLCHFLKDNRNSIIP
jgi:hypothetical protein